MRMIRFKVQNYKKIKDTDWIKLQDLTAFVGKNEAGKSAIFRALSKLNPSDGEPYDPLKEFPRRRYSKEYTTQDWWPVATAEFELTSAEKSELGKEAPSLKGTTQASATRYYNNKLWVEFPGRTLPEMPTLGELRGEVETTIEKVSGLAAPEGKGEVLGQIKEAVKTKLQVHLPTASESAATKAQIEQLLSVLTSPTNEAWQKTLLDPLAVQYRNWLDRSKLIEEWTKAQALIKKHLPKFVYFDRYDILESAIHIPTFLGELSNNAKHPRHRVTHCLFKHVGLDLQEMQNLGAYDRGRGDQPDVRRRLDEMSIKAKSAEISMTDYFRKWWVQRDHKFVYDFQGEYFRIWVSDDIDPSPIELDQRSMGLQYFFSFYLVFLVESEGAFENCVLLLDEPGTHLHGLAQGKIVEFFHKLAKENQLLYSTHSPFMVDAERLELARAVFEGSDGTTKVSEDVWPKDKDSLFPLQAALGYQLAQALFVAKRQVLVEGITDYWIFKAIDQALAGMGRTRLRTDVILVPTAGIVKLFPLASMLVGHDVKVAALLDGDEPARREGKKLIDKLLAGEDRKCLFLGDFLVNKAGETEDLFPEDYYLSAVKDAYPAATFDFNDEEKKAVGVVDKVKALFARKVLGEFEKWRPAAILRDRISADSSKVPDSVFTIMETVFDKLNSLFPK